MWAPPTRVILPWANRNDVEQYDVPKEVRARMKIDFTRTVREVLNAGVWCWHVALACGRSAFIIGSSRARL